MCEHYKFITYGGAMHTDWQINSFPFGFYFKDLPGIEFKL